MWLFPIRTTKWTGVAVGTIVYFSMTIVLELFRLCDKPVMLVAGDGLELEFIVQEPVRIEGVSSTNLTVSVLERNELDVSSRRMLVNVDINVVTIAKLNDVSLKVRECNHDEIYRFLSGEFSANRL